MLRARLREAFPAAPPIEIIIRGDGGGPDHVELVIGRVHRRLPIRYIGC